MIKNQVDCIVRFHDAKRLYELERCIFSLVGQKHRPLHIIIAVQRFTDAQIADTRAALVPLLSLPNPPAVTIRNWESASPNDARTELLNMGLAAATGQYVSFLDYDDVLYPEAYVILIERLKVSGNAIAFATVRVVNAEVFPEFIHVAGQKGEHFVGEDLRDLFRGNFCPIHSYLIDRSIVSPDILSFDTAITWEEDYDLLLKICAAYPSDFANVKKPIGDYYYKNDGSNSVPTNGMLSEERALEYKRIQAFIEGRRRTTLVAPPRCRSNWACARSHVP
ncbi:glycosyltransferase [Undibacterium arcticum]